jgi:hypothetical protein
MSCDLRFDCKQASKVQAWEMFSFVTAENGDVALKTHHGTFVSMHPDGEIRTTRTWGGAWEAFRLEHNSDGSLSFLNVGHSRYLCAVDNGKMRSAQEKKGWETFWQENQGHGTFALKTFHSKYMSAPPIPDWSFCAIGSAGHGHGTAKDGAGKSEFGELSTSQDIDDCESFCFRNFPKYHYFGAMNVKGAAGDKSGCIRTLQKFFEHCKVWKQAPIVYYTGHGEGGSGNWCFPDGEKITLQEVLDLNTSGYRPTFWCDCCFSGMWLYEPGDFRIITAAGKEQLAYNRVFALATFQGSREHQKILYSKTGALQNDGGQEVERFSGESGAVITMTASMPSSPHPSPPKDGGCPIA